MSGAAMPVFSMNSVTKVPPTRLIMELVTRVVMISRRSRWRAMNVLSLSWTGPGK